MKLVLALIIREVDLQLRSNRGCEANDHSFEERGKEKHEVEAGGGADDGDADLDRKRKRRLNEQLGSSRQLVIAIGAPPISVTDAEAEHFNGGSSRRLHHHRCSFGKFSPIRCFYWQSNNVDPPLAFSFGASLFGRLRFVVWF